MSEDELDIIELRSHLTKELPEYMVPTHLVQLEKLHVNDNGKIDRRALPDVKAQYHVKSKYVHPSTTNIWQEVLDVKRVGMHGKKKQKTESASTCNDSDTPYRKYARNGKNHNAHKSFFRCGIILSYLPARP